MTRYKCNRYIDPNVIYQKLAAAAFITPYGINVENDKTVILFDGDLSDDEKFRLSVILNVFRYFIADNSTITSSSDSFILVDGLSITPLTGTYLIEANLDVQTAVNGGAELAIGVNSSILPASNRTLAISALGIISDIRNSLNLYGVYACNGTDEIKILYKSLGGSITIRNRILSLSRIA